LSNSDKKGFSIRTAEYKGNTLVNICDEEIIGRTVREGKLVMHISKEYFSGEIVSEQEALELIKKCSIVSLSGERSVALAIKNKIGSEEAVRKIEDIPFLMIYKFMR
jgi:hypothetical protein